MSSNTIVAEKLFNSLTVYIRKLKEKNKADKNKPLFSDKPDKKIDILDKDFDKIDNVQVDRRRHFM